MDPENLGPYRIEKLLGRGGMGTVYEGIDEETDLRVAVKVLSPALVHDINFRERFVTEVETLKKLHHPNIVEMFGFGEQEGQLFYSMELVKGRNLQEELVAGRRFDWREVTGLAVQICAALKHAHDRGIVHRDLKPANLLLTGKDQIKLLDFGIAKLFGASQMTMAGGVIGTADYMSPEQAAGRPVTARSDLYSLGAVIYCLLAGHPPFHGKSLPEVIHSLRFEQAPPIRRLVPTVPLELEQIIAQLLDKDPEQRVATPMSLAKRLRSMEFALSVDTRIDDAPPAGANAARANADGTNAGRSATEPGSLTRGTGDPTDAVMRPKASGGTDHGTDNGTGKGTDVNLADIEDSNQVSTSVDDRSPLGGLDATLMSTSTRPTAELLDDDVDYQLANLPDGTLDSLAGTAAEAELGPAARKTHFTTVEADRERQRRQSRRSSGPDGPAWLKPLAAAAMFAAAMALFGGVWFATRPSSADAIYTRLAEAAREGDPQGLSEVSRDMKNFIELYPDDQRVADVKLWQRDLEAYRFLKKLERQARRVGGATYLKPVEQAFVRAMRSKRSDIGAARRQFEFLLTVFGEGDQSDQEATECVLLARHELTRLELPKTRPQTDHESELARRLDWARKNLNGDELRDFQRGVVGLFGDELWAEEIVKDCRESLRN